MGPEILSKSKLPNQRTFKLDLFREGLADDGDPSKPMLLRRQQQPQSQIVDLNAGSATSNMMTANSGDISSSKGDDIVLRAQQMAEEAKLRYSETASSVKTAGQKRRNFPRKPSGANVPMQLKKRP